jgi:hypothetical protein
MFTDMTPEVKYRQSMPRSLDEVGGTQQLLSASCTVCKVPSLQVSLFLLSLLGYPDGYEKLYQMLGVLIGT